ncbi:hypothetical protein D3C85_1343360 [compost metagenome]
MAPTVFDDTQALELAGGVGHAFAAYTQHVGDQLLGHGQFIALQAIERQQQPAAQLLVDGVVAVAHCRLGHLRDQGLGVAQHQQQHFFMAVELVLELLAG